MTVRVLRGRADGVDADREATAAALDRVGETGEPAVRAWTPHRQLAFGRRDAREDGYPAARRAAEARGFPPVERGVGGRAVAYTGTTVAFAHAEPVQDMRRGMDDRYARCEERVASALRGLGVPVERGEPPGSFCPGDHSLSVAAGGDPPDARAAGDGAVRPATGKVVGIAQRVTRRAALTSGVVLVADRAELVDVLTAVYDALDLAFDPDSVGTVADAGGPADADRVARAIEDALVDGRQRRVVQVDSA